MIKIPRTSMINDIKNLKNNDKALKSLKLVKMLLFLCCIIWGLLLVACQVKDSESGQTTEIQGIRDFETIQADFLLDNNISFGDTNAHVLEQLKNNGIKIQKTNEFILDEVPCSTIVVKYDEMSIAYRFRHDALTSIGRTTNVKKEGVQKYWDLLGEPDEETEFVRDSENARFRYTDKKYYWRGSMDGQAVELIVSYWGWPEKYSVDFELNE